MFLEAHLFDCCSLVFRNIELSCLTYQTYHGNSLTLRTLPFLSLYTFTMWAIGHWFRSASCLSNTMSPNLRFRFLLFHLFLLWGFSRTSFLCLSQNSLATCCTLLNCFLEYLSGVVKLPGGGITNLDFNVRRLVGFNGAKLLASFITSVVCGLELAIASTSRTRVCIASSVKLLPRIFSSEFRIERALLICYFQTPPILLAWGRFFFPQHPIATIFF